MLLAARATLDELEKLGAVSPEQARRALDQLDALEQNKADARQVARYGISGALTGAGISALGNVIEKKPIGGLRGVGAMAVKGALGAGAVPLLQAHLDRKAQMGTLQQFVQQQEQPKLASEKDSGFLGDLASKAKSIALTDVGGPKGVLTPIGQAAANAATKAKKPGADFAAWQAKQRLKAAAACLKEKDSGAFDGFMGGAGKALGGLVSSAPRAAQSVQKAMPRQLGSFTPAVVGMPARAAAKLPLPTGALNPGGGFH